MTVAEKARTKSTRGPHAERSASMRQRLVDAAIACLCRVGYAATTTQLVMDEAGVSRGAMLHHFPTKVDLVIAVGEYAAAAQNRHVRRRLAVVPEGMERYLALTETTWEAMCQPPAIALVEIMVASRSDPSLGERFPQVIDALEAQQREDVWVMAQELGIADRDSVERMIRLHRAAMRGLALEQVFKGDRGSAEAAMELLEWYKRELTGKLLIQRSAPLFPEAQTVTTPEEPRA
ncbi:AcrR family transcriptional regulator [Sphingomonas naasensis]|uniref:TetR/AcrR family transcriptional regulator n=1 Tax=Sphingomonas naasensis TaxID=1344951 RepID=A0A4S1WSN2_9SPHN|nr:TetR/AcrR family transcriptional regulator [Sphingomonas naasensis]NIJ20285.1 AcrR family transcriptional regulator [Sphingomonas naasensis]TGX44416.1 TetR/AcrR family transcriptional regulator [Sphingomonas naasensis]